VVGAHALMVQHVGIGASVQTAASCAADDTHPRDARRPPADEGGPRQDAADGASPSSCSTRRGNCLDRSAGQAEIVEADGDNAIAVVGDVHGLVAVER